MNNHEERDRVRAILTMHLSQLGEIIDSRLQFPPSFPRKVLHRHVVALEIDDVRVSESGIAAKVSVSTQGLLEYPPDGPPQWTEFKEFRGVVQIQAKGKLEDLGDFDRLEFVPPARLLSWQGLSVPWLTDVTLTAKRGHAFGVQHEEAIMSLGSDLSPQVVNRTATELAVRLRVYAETDAKAKEGVEAIIARVIPPAYWTVTAFTARHDDAPRP